MELLLHLSIAPRYKDIEHKKTCLPDLSGQSGSTQNAKHSNKRERIYSRYPKYYTHSHASSVFLYIIVAANATTS
jgi:hypothetical protein